MGSKEKNLYSPMPFDNVVLTFLFYRHDSWGVVVLGTHLDTCMSLLSSLFRPCMYKSIRDFIIISNLVDGEVRGRGWACGWGGEREGCRWGGERGGWACLYVFCTCKNDHSFFFPGAGTPSLLESCPLQGVRWKG